MPSYFIYILQCKDGSLYTGWTTDVIKRLAQHNLGKGAKYTRGRLPVALVYSEKLSSKKKAMQREYEIKHFSRSEKSKIIISVNRN